MKLTRRIFLSSVVCGFIASSTPTAEKKLNNVWRKLPDGWELIRMKYLNVGDMIKIDTVPGEYLVVDGPTQLPNGVWSVNVGLPNEI